MSRKKKLKYTGSYHEGIGIGFHYHDNEHDMTFNGEPVDYTITLPRYFPHQACEYCGKHLTETAYWGTQLNASEQIKINVNDVYKRDFQDTNTRDRLCITRNTDIARGIGVDWLIPIRSTVFNLYMRV